MSDAYRIDERREIHAALEAVLGDGQPDWMPTGVYAYWDVETHDLLYLGLAADLIGRFAQHNRLVRHSGGNKANEIDAYFEQHEYLGFTVLVQSKAVRVLEQVQRISPLMGANASGMTAVGEGQLIEIHRLVHGCWPAWNKVGGARDGKRWATKAAGLLEVLALRRDSLFAARRPLRTVATDLRVRLFEAAVHTARLRTVMGPMPRFGSTASEEEVRERILHSIMLRDGRLVADLAATDQEIRDWLVRLSEPGSQHQEAADLRALVEEQMAGAPEADRRMFDFIDQVVAESADDPRQLVASRALREASYLDSPLVLPDRRT
jgi:hypothetical protein